MPAGDSGSSNGRRASSAGSPVDDRPAAWVSVAKPMPRRCKASSSCQSSTKPADGGSNATGGPAIRVHTSQSASGSARCAYCTGRPWRAMPALDRVGVADEADLDQARMAERCEHRRPRAVRAAAGRPAPASGGGAGLRCGCESRLRRRRRRESAASSSGATSEARPARRTSIAAPLGRCLPARLAGRVAASLATTRSPAASSVGQVGARMCRQATVGIDDQEAGIARPLDRQGGGLHARSARDRRGALAVDPRDDLAGRVARPLQRRRIGVGHARGRAAACPCRPDRRRRRRRRAAGAPRPRSGSGAPAPPCSRRTRPSRRKA